MASDRPSLVLNYTANPDGYVVALRSVDGAQVFYPPFDIRTRRELVEFVFESVRRFKPSSFGVRIGDGPVLPIAKKTVEDIRSGKLIATDFVINGEIKWQDA
jgi:hypothetical protein